MRKATKQKKENTERGKPHRRGKRSKRTCQHSSPHRCQACPSQCCLWVYCCPTDIVPRRSCIITCYHVHICHGQIIFRDTILAQTRASKLSRKCLDGSYRVPFALSLPTDICGSSKGFDPTWFHPNSFVIGPMFGKFSVWPMYALVFQLSHPTLVGLRKCPITIFHMPE